MHGGLSHKNDDEEDFIVVPNDMALFVIGNDGDIVLLIIYLVLCLPVLLVPCTNTVAISLATRTVRQ